MRNLLPLDALLSLRIAFVGDDCDDAPMTEMGRDSISRLLLHRMDVLQAAMRRVAELQREAACAPPPDPPSQSSEHPADILDRLNLL
jgi:hypothetical protein